MLDDLEFKNNRDYFLGILKKEDICISQVGRSKDVSLIFVKQSVEDLKESELNDSEDNKIKDIKNNLE